MLHQINGFSLLKHCTPPRELPVALGQYMANTKLGSLRWPALCRLFNSLDPAGKLACRGELRACQHAKRNPVEARVA